MPTDTTSGDREQSVARVSLVVALLLAATLQTVIAYRSMVIGKDGVLFIHMAERLTESPGALVRENDQHPGFPAMILGAHQLTSPFIRDPVFSWIAAARIVGGVTGLLTLILVWQLSRRLLGGYAAAMAALIFAVQPMFCSNAVDVMSDTPHLFFYMLGAWAACEGLMRTQWAWFPAAGASGALAYWIRPEGLCVALVTVGLLGVLALLRRDRRSHYLVGAMTTLAVMAILVAPYVLLKGGLTSKKRLMPNGFVIRSMDLDRPVNPAKPATSIVPAVAGWAPPMPDPRLLLSRCLEGFRYVLILPLLVGIFAAGGRRAPRDPTRLILGLVAVHVALLLALSAIAGYISERHTMPIVALAMPWVGYGAWRILLWTGRWLPYRERLAAKLGHVGTVLAAGLIAVAPMIPRTVRPLHARHQVFADLGLELRSWSSPEDKVFSNLPYTAFYANRTSNTSEGIRVADVIEHPSYAKGYRFIVLDLEDKRCSDDWVRKLLATHNNVSLSGRGKSWSKVILLVRKVGFGVSEAGTAGQ